MAYVYTHHKSTNKEIFYVGIGIKENHFRATDISGRNTVWRRTVNKHGFYHQIVADNISWGEACKMETELIEKYGRRDLGNGPLVNMTNGGDGLVGLIRTNDHKEKISKTLLGHTVSKNTRKILSDKLKVKMKGLREKTTSEREKISKSKLGEKNWMHGRKGSLAPFFKGFIEAYKDGILIGTFAGIYDCREKLNVCYKKVSACLNGKRKTTGGYSFKRKA